MRGLMIRIFAWMAVAALSGCQWLPQPKDVDQGKVDRAMEQVETGAPE